MGDAGWVMSLIARDMDSDGDIDLVISDRKTGLRNIFSPLSILYNDVQQRTTGPAEKSVGFQLHSSYTKTSFSFAKRS